MAFALRMAKLTRDPKTGNWKSRKAIPEDCRALFGKREDKPVWRAQLTGVESVLPHIWSGPQRVDRFKLRI